MSTFEDTPSHDTGARLDPYDEPVAYLARLGIEAELVAVLAVVPEAA